MKLSEMWEPASQEPPCGPDLELAEDPAFLDYYYEAEGRLPERYFTPGSTADNSEDRLFDPRSINLPAEEKTIMALLARSRDVRLVSLLARFQVLAGRLKEFSVSVGLMADLLSQWPDSVHPRMERGATERRSAVEALNSQPMVVMPLTHLPLLSDANISLRRYLVSAGNLPPRMSEEGLPGADLAATLRNPANQRALALAQEHLAALAAALHRLQNIPGLSVDLGAVRGVVAEMQGMIAGARPELPAWTEDQAPPATLAVETSNDRPSATQPAAAPAVNASYVPNRVTATAILDAAQHWLARSEPSSAALLLVVQARQLVGVPLVEALEVLMPDRAGTAALQIGQNSGFSLPMERLRHLTKTGLDNTGNESEAVAPPTITDRTSLISLLLGVEHYFGGFEPSSPIPLLLARARALLDKRFDAIVAAMLASAPPDS